MKAIRRVILTLIVLLVLLLGMLLGTRESDKNYNLYKAIIRSEELLLMCEEYSHSGSDKKYPSSLADLVTPPFGGSPNLRDTPQHYIIDPWGNPYKYAMVKNAQGKTELYVWTECVVKGKLKLLGAKMIADGSMSIVRFGHPE
jgi:hypothetical protein